MPFVSLLIIFVRHIPRRQSANVLPLILFFVFIVTEIKLYAFEGYGQQFLGKIILHSFS